MGGGIGVESAPGQGSRFWFWVPATPAEAVKGRSVDDGAPALPSGCRVLVADDNSANRDLARCLLEPFGAVIQEAADGRAAVELAETQPFDVILMDVRMPGFDGPEAMKQIRSGRGPNRRAPILAFSADVGSHGAPDFLALGFDGQIGKPLTVLDLISTIAAFAARPVRKPRAGKTG
jgi:CheY-like chemotaxis protein